MNRFCIIYKPTLNTLLFTTDTDQHLTENRHIITFLHINVLLIFNILSFLGCRPKTCQFEFSSSHGFIEHLEVFHKIVEKLTYLIGEFLRWQWGKFSLLCWEKNNAVFHFNAIQIIKKTPQNKDLDYLESCIILTSIIY